MFQRLRGEISRLYRLILSGLLKLKVTIVYIIKYIIMWRNRLLLWNFLYSRLNFRVWILVCVRLWKTLLSFNNLIFFSFAWVLYSINQEFMYVNIWIWKISHEGMGFVGEDQPCDFLSVSYGDHIFALYGFLEIKIYLFFDYLSNK